MYFFKIIVEMMQEGDEKLDIEKEEIQGWRDGFCWLKFPGHQEINIKVIMSSDKLVKIMYAIFLNSSEDCQ